MQTTSVLASTRPASAEPSRLAPAASPTPAVEASPHPTSLPSLAAASLVGGTVTIDASYILQLSQSTALGSGIVGNNGGGIISNNGGGILANNGGNVIAIGASLLSNNSASLLQFGLLDTAATPATAPPRTLPVGTLLPAYGMQVGVTSLATGKAVPVGTDAAGAPAYSVLTDITGGYKLTVPGTEAQNVAVVALVPQATDRRLSYQRILSPAGGQDGAIDEDNTLVTTCIRTMLRAQVQSLLFAADITGVLALITLQGQWSDAERAQITAAANAIRAAGTQAGLSPTTPIDIQASVSARAADAMLQGLRLDQVAIDPLAYPTYTGASVPAEQAIQQVLALLRDKAAAKETAQPGYFTTAAYIVAANAGRPASQAFVIARPSDVGDFIAEAYYGMDAPLAAVDVNNIFWDLQVNDNNAGGDRTSLFHASLMSLFEYMTKAFATDAGMGRTRALGTLAGS